MFDILLSIFFLVQARIPALHSIGTGEGDVLPFIRPLDFIAPAFHLPDKFFLVPADLHSLGHIVHQPELPALALSGNPVLPAVNAFAAFFIGWKNRHAMFPAQIITDSPELSKCTGILPEFPSVNMADGVDYKVGVDVLGITVGGHQHLMSRPSLRCKRSGDGMGLAIGDILSGGEGLDILIEVDAIHFAVGMLGGEELRDGIQSVAADAADIPLSGQPIHRFDFLQAVPHDAHHSTGMLPGFLDVSYGRH